MPTYQITDTQTGKVFKVTGTSPPSETEAAQIFSDYYKSNGGEPTQDPRAAFLAANPQDPSANYPMAEHTPDSTWDKINKGLGYIDDKLSKEPLRLAQEAITFPINSAINVGRKLHGISKGEDYDTAKQAAAAMQVQGPLDPSMTGRVVGKVVEAGSDVARSAGVPQPAIDAVLDTAGIYGGAKVLGKVSTLAKDVTAPVVIKAVGTKPETLMEGTLKQRTTVPQGKRNQNINTALEGGYLPNKEGVANIAEDIAATNDRIGQIIEGAKQQNSTVKVDDVVNRIEELRTKANADTNWKQNNADIDAVIDGLKTNPNVVNGEIPADVAQQIKVNIGKQSRYGEFNTFTEEGRKAAARGIKEELASQFPELAEANAKDSALYQLQGELERAANRIGNRESVGFGTGLKLAAAAASHGPFSPLLALEAVVSHPAVAPRLALQLYKARKGAISHLQARSIVGDRLQAIKDNIRNMAAVEAAQPTQGEQTNGSQETE